MPWNIWRVIWEISERSGIGLVRYGPFVFGRMIGATGVKVEEA